MVGFIHKVDISYVFSNTINMAWVHKKERGVIMHPCTNFSGGLLKPRYKLGRVCVTTTHIKFNRGFSSDNSLTKKNLTFYQKILFNAKRCNAGLQTASYTIPFYFVLLCLIMVSEIMLCCGLKAICQTETSLLHMMEFVLHLKRSNMEYHRAQYWVLCCFLFILMICVMFVVIVCPFYLLMSQIFLQLVKHWMILRNWLTRNLLTFLCGWMQIGFPWI